ncbi:MAG: ADP-ribose pyrophosphatase [Rhodopirellula sp. TMED11]|nr:MAG: ADP-ribose pyrophosphatase [Rhodopirellula sp. TMED11]
MNSSEGPQEEIVLRGNRFDVHRLNLVGSDGQTYQREVIRHPGAVVLLPILDDGRLVMIQNTRATVGETLLELPAGTREPDEPVETTADRELIEETGYRAGALKLIHTFYSAPGISDEVMYLFVATELSEGESAREATEQIENQIATREEVREWLAADKIKDAKTLVGLYAFLAM